MFATVQNLGRSVVVFGVGETKESAEQDARRNGLEQGETVRVTAEQVKVIEGGKVEFRNGELG